MRRLVKLALAFLAATAAVGFGASLWAIVWGDAALLPLDAGAAAATAIAAIATAANLAGRFVRWQHLLRRLDVRIPLLTSLGGFTASFAFLPIPLYLGQVVARVRLTPGFTKEARSRLVLAFVWERALDVVALSMLAISSMLGPLALAGFTLLAFLPGVRRRAVRLASLVARYGSRSEPTPIDRRLERELATMRVFTADLTLSVVSWMVTCGSLLPLGMAAGIDLDASKGISLAAYSILLGGLSLVPLGGGVAGGILFLDLQELGSHAAAAQATFLFRMATAWLTLGIGAVAWLVVRQRARRPRAADHFDEIDECYDAWLPEPCRNHVVAKKVARMKAHLIGRSPVLGLDIGCGRGWYLGEMQVDGARLVGIDLSTRQLAAARSRPDATNDVARASVTHLPFTPGTFDFAFVINLLHHLPSREDQRRALLEIRDAVRPGGLVFIHEMNVINPLFRFYVSYVFTLLRGIDEGTELYLNPDVLKDPPGLARRAVEFFTFLPEFTPRVLMPWLAAIESRLERGRFARYAAHFLLVYERVD